MIALITLSFLILMFAIGYAGERTGREWLKAVSAIGGIAVLALQVILVWLKS